MSAYLKYTFLYEFALGANVWRYTANAEDVIDIDGNVWEASAVSDDGVSQSGESTSDSMSITVPIDIPPARLFMFAPPAKVMDARILVAEFQDKTPPPVLAGTVDAAPSRLIPVINRRVQYVGEIVQCGFPSPGTAVFVAETISASMRQEGLRGGWQRQCPHALYDPLSCKVDKAAFAYAATIVSIGGFTVVVTGDAGTFPLNLSGGLLEFNHPIKGQQTLMIEAQSSDSLRMFGSISDLWVGMSITLYPGCNQTPESCIAFGNLPNYGGFPAMPGKSPFDGVDSPTF